jgi:two-component system, OmpR family, phosphate regulon sensor histidine kinase PhoR
MNRAYFRLASGYVLLIAAVFLILSVYVVRQIDARQQAEWRNQQIAQVRVIAAASDSALAAGDTGRLADLAQRVAASTRGTVTVVDANGVTLASSDPAAPDPASAPDVQDALAGQTGRSEFWNPATSRVEFAASAPVLVDGDVAGAARLTVPVSAAPSLWSPLVRLTLGALILCGVAIAIVSAMMPRIIIGPLAELARVARQVADGDMHARVDIDTFDEVAELAVAFNEMTDELREHLESLDIERARLETIVEHLNDGILIVDHRGAVSLMNRAAEHLLGIDRQRALVRSYAEVVRDYELVSLIRDSRSLYTGEGTPPNRFIELGRPRRSVQAFAYPILRGESDPVIVILRDITELRRTETIRRDFVANVSHDLRTPIASLKALVETLLDGALEDDAVARDFLQRMEVEVDDLARLVEELLELSRAESRQIELHRIRADLGNLARRAVARLQPQAESKAIDLRVDLPAGLPLGSFDPERIEQVLVNLLQNAVKFTPANGTVTVSLRQERDELVTSVADTGPGIPSEEIDRVFERFYKADRSRSNSGSGLGLAIAKHLVQLHGGRIWAESPHTGGAIFRFSVPVATGQDDHPVWLDAPNPASPQD